MPKAEAGVGKEFFVDMFTRDISLEDCILDLIDNSIDSFLRREHINISQLIFKQSQNGCATNGDISVSCTDRQIKIEDNCGGIDRHTALHDAFRFGHRPADEKRRLGAYGVGLKRALFKLGRSFHIISRTSKDGFEVKLDLENWLQSDEWKIPIEFIDAAKDHRKAGTTITVTNLRPEVKVRIVDGGVPARVKQEASSTYSFFLKDCISLHVNGVAVEGQSIPIGSSEEITPAKESFEMDGVRVTLVATIRPSLGKLHTEAEAGWSVLCNGRVIVRADKTELTGWNRTLPGFHSKYNSFVGMALFESTDPLSLPWTTTKRSINQESQVFIRAKAIMSAMSQPIISLLNKKYKSDPVEDPVIREAVKNVQALDFPSIAQGPRSTFSFAAKKVSAKTTTRICFDAKIADVEKIKSHLKRPHLSNGDLGKLAFNHYLKNECD